MTEGVGWFSAAEVLKCHGVMKLDLRDVRSHTSWWSDPFFNGSGENSYAPSLILFTQMDTSKVCTNAFSFHAATGGKGWRRMRGEKRKAFSLGKSRPTYEQRGIGCMWASRCLFLCASETPGGVIVWRYSESVCLSSAHAYSHLSAMNNGAEINAGLISLEHDGLMLCIFLPIPVPKGEERSPALCVTWPGTGKQTGF